MEFLKAGMALLVVIGLCFLCMRIRDCYLFMTQTSFTDELAVVTEQTQQVRERADALLDEAIPQVIKMDLIFQTQILNVVLNRKDKGGKEAIEKKLEALATYKKFIDGIYDDLINGNFNYNRLI